MNTNARNAGAMSSSPVFLSLLITFILGFAIGFSLCYAWLAEEAKTASKALVATAPPLPGQQAAPAPAPEDTGALSDLQPGRHLIVAISGPQLAPEQADLIRHIHPGAVLLRPENIQSAAQAQELVRAIHQAAGATDDAPAFPLIAADPDVLALSVPGPGLPELLAARDTARAREAGRALAEAYKAYGVQLVFAPALSIGVPPGAPVPARTGAVPDADAVTAVGLAYADGIVSAGVLPVATRYPGAAAPGQADPLAAGQDVAGLAELLLPFTEALARGMPGLRVEHVAVPALDIHFPDRPASLSPVLVRRLLRTASEPYEGVIVADDVAAPAVAGRYAAEDAVVEALAAGCDAVIFTETDSARVRAVCAAVARAVQDGILTREQLEEVRHRMDGWLERVREPQPLTGPLPDVEPLRLAEAEPAPQPPAPSTEAAVETEPAPPAPEVTPEASEEAPAAETTPPVEEAAAPAPAAEPESSTPPVETANAEAADNTPPEGTEKITYTIKKGDRLFRIAREFGVSPQDIVQWNNLPDENIKWGARLVIYKQAAPTPEPQPAPPVETPAPAVPEAPPAEEMAAAAPPASEAQPPAETPAAAPPQDAPPEDEIAGAPTPSAAPESDGLVRITYEVQRGDMLSKLAAKFGVKQSEIMKWSKLSNPNIQRGRKLTVYLDPAKAAELGYATEAPPPADIEPAAPAGTIPEDWVKQEHTVAAGETLETVAQQYGVVESDIAAWNGLADGKISEGQVLTLYTPSEYEPPSE